MSDALSSLFNDAEPRRFDAGAQLFHSGDLVRNMFLVAEGAVDLTRVTGAGAPVDPLIGRWTTAGAAFLVLGATKLLDK